MTRFAWTLLLGLLAPATAHGVEVTVAPVAGVTAFDRDLDNYRWDLGPHPTWGLEVRATRGRFGLGWRASRTATTQATGIPGETQQPDVRLTSVEMLGEVSVLEWRGTEALVLGQFGRLHLGYDPDVLVLDPGSGPIEVRYQALDEWTGGLGLGLRHAFPAGPVVGLAAERSWFGLDTSHRAGDDIVERRETFGNWTVRASVGWGFGR